MVNNEASHRVDVLVDGQPFISYIWPQTVTKSTLSIAHRIWDDRHP